MSKPAITMLAAIAILAVCLPGAALSQDRQSGPWWPNAEWGPDDQAGASNRITAEKILASIDLVETGKVYELGRIYESSMPLFSGRSYSLAINPSDAAGGANRLVANDDYLETNIGQVGTQFDGLGHVGQELEYADGSTHRVFYNGYTAEEMQSGEGLRKLGVEHVKPIITRGVLVDVAGLKGVEHLEAGYEVTIKDVEAALERTGLDADDIRPGDAVLFRFGWSALWNDPENFNQGEPGIGLEVAQWLAEKKVAMTGGDSWGTEVVPNPDPTLSFPVHHALLVENGIFNLENMRFDDLVADDVYEFLFIMTPIRFRGATGSPARPIAIR